MGLRVRPEVPLLERPLTGLGMGKSEFLPKVGHAPHPPSEMQLWA